MEEADQFLLLPLFTHDEYFFAIRVKRCKKDECLKYCAKRIPLILTEESFT